jgi:3-hydroxy-3-methylglutaryl CoA synthase
VARTTNYGITGYGGYVPRLRMERSAIAAAHQWMAPGLASLSKGQRAFCSWDEDSITMGVEAARDALGDRAREHFVNAFFASTTMPFSDLQNAAILSNALGLPDRIRTLDIGQSQRAGTSGLLAALAEGAGPSLFVASDRPRGKPASTQEMNFGAGAAAFSLGSEDVIAALRGSSSSTAMFVDHFRSADGKYDYFWEERWIRDEGYLRLVPPAVQAALVDAGVAASDIRHFVLPSSFKGIAAAMAKKCGIPAQAEADGLGDRSGYAGAAHGLLMLAHVLEKAVPGEHILVIGFGQGCDALVLETTDAITAFKPRRGVGGALADGISTDAYLRMLSFDDGVELEWGMRAEKTLKTAFTEQYRSNDQLGNFQAGTCRACGTTQFPQLPFCVNPGCNAPAAQFDPVSLVDVKAKVMTCTADWLSYHPAPPLYVGFVQFDNGARVLMETVDVGAAGLDVGMALNVVFRIKDVDKVRRYPRYFWKTTPVQA